MEASSTNQTDKWQVNKSLAETNLHLLENEILSDVTFLVGEREDKVQAHKCILASRSPVFYAMFCGPLAESNEAIRIPDTETDIFKTMIRFLYTENCSISGDSVMALIYAAKKYEVLVLVERCSEFVRSNIDPENVCVVLDQAVVFDEQELVKKCLSYIIANGEEILKSSTFLNLTKEALQMILESDNFAVAEKTVYTMCIEWAKQQCVQDDIDTTDTNIRDKLGNLIYLIRFPAMSAADFTAVVSMSGILTDKEKVVVFQTFVDKTLSQDIFPSSPRFPVFEPGTIFERFKKIEGVWSHNGQTNAIAFTVSRNVKLTAVSVFLPTQEGHIRGKVEIADDVEELFEYRYFRLSYDKDKKFELVSLSCPVDLKANVRYHVLQTCDGRPTYMGICGEKDVTKGDVKVSFEVSSKNIFGRNTESQGQIHGIQLQ